MPDLRPEETGAGAKKRFPGPMRTDHCVPEMDYSLRAYCSILYLKPRTQIILRQRKVQSKLVAKSLANIENDVYKPSFINKRVKITFGFNCKNREHCGIMMYHKNRLIKSYEKVGCQIKSTSRGAGVGVIGVIECNFLKPAHNKQDFEYTKEYRLTLAALGMKLNDYWREKKEKKAKEKAARAKAKKEKQLAEEEEEEEEEEDEEEEEEEEIDPDQRWVQCEECLKWRKMPVWMSPQSLPERWNCSLHPDPRSRSCLVPEDPEESEDELTPSYEKTFKKQDPTWDRKRSRSLEEAKRRPGLARGMSEPSNHSTGKVKEKEEEEQTSEYSAPCGEEDLQAVCSNKRKAPWRQCSADKKLCAGLESPALSHPRAKCEEEKEEEREEEKEEEEEEEEEEGGQVEEDGYEEEDEEEDDGEENPIEVTVKQEHRRTPPMTGSSQKPLASPTAPAPSPGKRELRRPAPPLSICAEGMDRVTLCQRVAQLEREADRLRGILGTPPLPRSPLAEPGPSPSPSSSPSLEHITDLYQQVTQERELLSQGLTEAAEKLVVMSAERDKYKLKASHCPDRLMVWRMGRREQSAAQLGLQ
ncbi:MORC3 protein, partial [Amia calva]|nr:MORC3 protein [Amia calva]